MKTTPEVRAVDPLLPSSAVIEEAAAVIAGGGVVTFPTRCLYGLGADALKTETVGRVFNIKRRPPDKPVLILVPDRNAVDGLAAAVPPAAEKLMQRFWPGRVTIVFDALPLLPANLVAGTGRIGIRLPRHPVARALVRACGRPITGTSANFSGRAGCRRIRDLDPRVAAQVDLILDGGSLEGGAGSTVVDVTGGRTVIVREGTVTGHEILAALK